MKRNVKILKNRKRFNALFIFLGFFNDNNTRIYISAYILKSLRYKRLFCTLRTEKKSVKKDKILIFIGMPKKGQLRKSIWMFR